MIRCKACDSLMSERELSSVKSSNISEPEDLCSSCIESIYSFDSEFIEVPNEEPVYFKDIA